jgi:hypothetical protein
MSRTITHRELLESRHYRLKRSEATFASTGNYEQAIICREQANATKMALEDIERLARGHEDETDTTTDTSPQTERVRDVQAAQKGLGGQAHAGGQEGGGGGGATATGK